MAQTMEDIVKLQIGSLALQLAQEVANNQALQEENESLKLKLDEHVRKSDELKLRKDVAGGMKEKV